MAVKNKSPIFASIRKEEQMMNAAMAAIRAVNTSVDPTYYGENPAGNINVGTNRNDNVGNIIHVGDNGGPETFGTNEGYFVKVREVSDKAVDAVKNVATKTKDVVKKKVSSISKDSYDMSGAVPKNVIMNSIVSDFAKNFGDDLNKRLNILEEMHKESLRHNQVTENFFKACLQMMVQIANASGNKSTSSALDAMISQIVH